MAELVARRRPRRRAGNYCPNCGHRQYCGCRHCKVQRHGPIWRLLVRVGIKKPWVWTTGEDIACGKCGIEADASWWSEMNIDTMCKLEGVKTLTEYIEVTRDRPIPWIERIFTRYRKHIAPLI